VDTDDHSMATLTDETIIVTGASKGLGRSMALHL